eukprot:scaffold21839_cov39-Tisochrysis_lutea.AAC.1
MAPSKKRSLSELSAELWGPPALRLPPAVGTSGASDLQREIDPSSVLPAVLRMGFWGAPSGEALQGVFRAIAVMRNGGWRAYEGCELGIRRIVSHRRYHRSGVGSFHRAGGIGLADEFAVGEVRIEQQAGERTPTGLLLPDHVCAFLSDGAEDASICGVSEGTLEAEEMRLLIYLVPEGQTLNLGEGCESQKLVTRPGDIELYTAFRSRGGVNARCLMRWAPLDEVA